MIWDNYLLEIEMCRRRLGVKLQTGYPVIIVVVIVIAGMNAQATVTREDAGERSAMFWLAFMLLFEIMK
jgi:hypothetical protein